MLTKILITAFVIALVATVSRWRTRRAHIPVVPLATVRAAQPPPAWLRPAAYAFGAIIVLGSATWYYTSWHDNQRVVIIRVINTGSGAVATYRAHKGSIDGRRFETTDGFTVRVADAERIEVQRLD
jgi:hypothetical protein